MCHKKIYLEERDINLVLPLCKYIRSPSFSHSIKKIILENVPQENISKEET